MSKVVVLFCLGLSLPLATATSQRQAKACLRYESDTVRLTGTLERHTYPGAPNYESIKAGDEAETGFYLRLAEPVCARGRPVGDGEVKPDEARRDSVDVVQLVLNAAGYAALRPALGQRVTVAGILFSSFTGHHHAPLLLRAVRRVGQL